MVLIHNNRNENIISRLNDMVASKNRLNSVPNEMLEWEQSQKTEEVVEETNKGEMVVNCENLELFSGNEMMKLSSST